MREMEDNEQKLHNIEKKKENTKKKPYNFLTKIGTLQRRNRGNDK